MKNNNNYSTRFYTVYSLSQFIKKKKNVLPTRFFYFLANETLLHLFNIYVFLLILYIYLKES